VLDVVRAKDLADGDLAGIQGSVEAIVARIVVDLDDRSSFSDTDSLLVHVSELLFALDGMLRACDSCVGCRKATLTPQRARRPRT